MFGDSDERFKLAGGNATLPEGIAARLGGAIHYSMPLKAIRKKADSFRLEFGTADSTQSVEADIVVLAIPFSVLRGIEIDADLPEWKTRAIKELPYGTNTKVMMGFTHRVWRDKGYVGEVFSDEQFQLAWDNTELNHSVAAGLTVYTGGNSGVEATKLKVHAQIESYLELLEKIFPGISAARNSKQARMDWISNPWSKGSYASYGPGHWTTIRGAEFKPVGNLHFAGEHCSLDFQGFMNGAAETGRRAAENIIASIR
jgi:monoamine oxidase